MTAVCRLELFEHMRIRETLRRRAQAAFLPFGFSPSKFSIPDPPTQHVTDGACVHALEDF